MHAVEQLPWIVIEAGSYHDDTGGLIAAGAADATLSTDVTKRNWVPVAFPLDGFDDDAVMVLTQVRPPRKAADRRAVAITPATRHAGRGPRCGGAESALFGRRPAAAAGGVRRALVWFCRPREDRKGERVDGWTVVNGWTVVLG